MIGADIPIVYDIVAITTVAILQTGMEKIINRSSKLEWLVEGECRFVVNNGLILFKVLRYLIVLFIKAGEFCNSAGYCSCRKCAFTIYFRVGTALVRVLVATQDYGLIIHCADCTLKIS